jgi:hypothetical protein
MEDLIPFDKNLIWMFTPAVVLLTVLCFFVPVNKAVLAVWAFIALFALFIYLIAPED